MNRVRLVSVVIRHVVENDGQTDVEGAVGDRPVGNRRRTTHVDGGRVAHASQRFDAAAEFRALGRIQFRFQPKKDGVDEHGGCFTKRLHRGAQVRKTAAVHFESPFSTRRPGDHARAGWRRAAVVTAAALLVAGLSACISSRRNRERFLSRVPPPQALLEASASFADGALQMQAWLGPTVRLRQEHDHAGKKEEFFGREHERGERGGEEEGEESGSPFRRGGGHPGQYTNAEINEMYGRENYQYVLPPRLALTFTFVNKSSRPLVFSVTDANSALGDFAPQPPTLTIGPGQKAEVDPMLSTIEDNFDELDVSVSVRLGGRTETKTLKLTKVRGQAPSHPTR